MSGSHAPGSVKWSAWISGFDWSLVPDFAQQCGDWGCRLWSSTTWALILTLALISYGILTGLYISLRLDFLICKTGVIVAPASRGGSCGVTWLSTLGVSELSPTHGRHSVYIGCITLRVVDTVLPGSCFLSNTMTYIQPASTLSCCIFTTTLWGRHHHFTG